MKEKFYITTAIAYTSGKPHFGNVYEIVLADAIARYKRLRGYDVFFQTGTDEHGQKIEEKALKANKSPQAYVDEVAGVIKEQFDMMNASYDYFIRTTDKNHKEVVAKIFKKLYDQGDIYLGKYEGWYCKYCESFFTESQLVDGKCPDCGREVIVTSEDAYFMNMSKYADRLMKHIEDHPNFIQPESRKNEMINNFLKPGLQDLCVSRTSFKWGIPVSFHPEHVVYVWIDALSNYISSLGYDPDGNHGELFKKYWPADIHLIGKDILRFHTIYWPIMLMALDLPLPKQIFGHPWLLAGDGKMSKSKGNVIYADDLVRYFTTDAVRYIMLHEMPFATDGKVSYESMIERINSDLANTLGNLVNRTISMTNKYFQGKVKNKHVLSTFDEDLIQCVSNTIALCSDSMDELKVQDALEHINHLYRRCNKFIDETLPWTLAKDKEQQDRLETVLFHLLEAIRVATILLSSFLPETAIRIFKQLNTVAITYEDCRFGVHTVYEVTHQPEILFARIDEKEMMDRISSELHKEVVKVSQKEEITIEDFNKVEMVVGEIVECRKHPKADKLLISKIDIGGEVRQIVSGIAESYQPEELLHKKVVVVINLKPALLKKEVSEGMILAGVKEDKMEVVFVQDLPVGSVIR